MYTRIEQVLKLIDTDTITDERKAKLQILIDYINTKRTNNAPVKLNFICTHNSRRSQFTQVWADVAALHFNIPIESYSGGVEITECNPRTIKSLKGFGFEVEFEPRTNPEYKVSYSKGQATTSLYSKLFDDEINPKSDFAAVMTCSHADENCPFVPGCEKRISLRYDDPKIFDDSPLEHAMYDYRSYQIATEMMYIFSKID